LLLGAAQKGDVAEKGVAAREEKAAKPDQGVERRRRAGSGAEIVAEIDQPVAGIEMLRQPRMKRDEPLGLAMNRGHRPDPLWAQEAGIDVRIAGRSRSHGGTNDGATPPARRPPSRRAQHLLDAADRRIFVDLFDRREFAHQPIERRLVNLALAIGLLGLAAIAIE